MIDVYDYAKYPTKEERMKICGDKADVINRIYLDNNVNKFELSLSDFEDGYYNIQMQYWLKEFNNRAFDLIVNYTLLKYYYDAGIPDEEWYKSPGENGKSVQYFPHFEKKHYGILYWFSFYVDSYYTRFEGLIDTIYHIINIKYRLGIKPSSEFRGNVLKKLKKKDKALFEYLNSLPDNPVYRQINEFRNNIVHNYRPNQIDSGFTRTINPDGSKIITMSVGNYTTSTEFLNNIKDSLDLLADITDVIRVKIKT
ncbi:MAG: hypothetical protein PWP07_843 [Epulopiscium sp.]|jgi:hypothetical protein|nr:hypothetical protein [Defluviitaleaceae bacterium]MDK2787618.1 hypothetical protein [Candidatus Epulonipiscium sp.]